jgi:hydrogenase maturation protease
MEIMDRTLVIGYGNLDRGDDGVAYYVVNALRQCLGQAPLKEYDTGLEELGAAVDSIFLTQLMPELIDTLADYDRVIFIDAHVFPDAPDLHCTSITPEYSPSAFTHHMTPATLLMLLKSLHQKEPKAYLVSLRGREFDFNRGLSHGTAALLQPAVEYIRELLGGKR